MAAPDYNLLCSEIQKAVQEAIIKVGIRHGAPYDHDAFVRQSEVSLDTMTRDVVMFGLDVYPSDPDDGDGLPIETSTNVVQLDFRRNLKRALGQIAAVLALVVFLPWAVVASQPTILDINGDGVVDVSDIVVMAHRWSLSTNPKLVERVIAAEGQTYYEIAFRRDPTLPFMIEIVGRRKIDPLVEAIDTLSVTLSSGGEG